MYISNIKAQSWWQYNNHDPRFNDKQIRTLNHLLPMHTFLPLENIRKPSENIQKQTPAQVFSS